MFRKREEGREATCKVEKTNAKFFRVLGILFDLELNHVTRCNIRGSVEVGTLSNLLQLVDIDVDVRHFSIVLVDSHVAKTFLVELKTEAKSNLSEPNFNVGTRLEISDLARLDGGLDLLRAPYSNRTVDSGAK